MLTMFFDMQAVDISFIRECIRIVAIICGCYLVAYVIFILWFDKD